MRRQTFDECMRNLEIPRYVKSIGLFQLEDRDWAVVGWKLLPRDTYETCGICGKKNIRELFFISNGRERRIVGNVCIDNITNKKIGNLFRMLDERRRRLSANKRIFAWVQGFIRGYETGEARCEDFFISKWAYKRFLRMRNRLCEGQNLTRSQMGLLSSYTRKYKRWHKRKRAHLND